MPSRISISLPNPIYERLKELAEIRDKAAAVLAAIATEELVHQEIKNGLLLPIDSTSSDVTDSSKSSIETEVLMLTAKLIDGESLDADEEELLADAINRAPHNVHIAGNKIRAKNGNGNAVANRI